MKCANLWDLFTVSCFHKAMFWKLHLLFITKGPFSDVNSNLGGKQFRHQGYYFICHKVTQAGTVSEKLWKKKNMMNFEICVH